MLVWTESCRNLLMSLFLFGGAEKGCELLDALPRTTREEAAVCKRRAASKDGWRRKETRIKGGAPLNWRCL